MPLTKTRALELDSTFTLCLPFHLVFSLFLLDPSFFSSICTKTFLNSSAFLPLRKQVALLIQNIYILYLFSWNAEFAIFPWVILSHFSVLYHSIQFYVTWEQQEVIHTACASVRSNMADVKLGAMPSEGLIWLLTETRELDKKLSFGELNSSRRPRIFASLERWLVFANDVWYWLALACPRTTCQVMPWLNALTNRGNICNQSHCTDVQIFPKPQELEI